MMYVSSPGREEVSRPVVTSWRRPVKTAVHQAVLDGRLHQVRLLVSKHGVNVDSKDMFGRTPLMLACLLENEEDGFKVSHSTRYCIKGDMQSFNLYIVLKPFSDNTGGIYHMNYFF